MQEEQFKDDTGQIIEIDPANTLTAEDKEFLDFELDDHELLEMGRANSSKYREVKKLENEKREAAEHYKNLIGGVQSEIERNNRLIETGVENREVDCVVKQDFKNRKVYYIYEGIVKKVEAMSDYVFTNRPPHIMPNAEAANNGQTTASPEETQKAEARQEEIAEKESSNQVASADVNQATEANTESSVINAAAIS